MMNYEVLFIKYTIGKNICLSSRKKKQRMLVSTPSLDWINWPSDTLSVKAQLGGDKAGRAQNILL